MNGNIKLILILIVVLVIFTFVTGANKGTEHFSNRECDKEYNSRPTRGACPSKCSNVKGVQNKQNNEKIWICTK